MLSSYQSTFCVLSLTKRQLIILCSMQWTYKICKLSEELESSYHGWCGSVAKAVAWLHNPTVSRGWYIKLWTTETQMGFVLFFASTFPISSPSSMLGWLLMMGSCVWEGIPKWSVYPTSATPRWDQPRLCGWSGVSLLWRFWEAS